MTEYGVQTNNIFDLLPSADEAVKPAAAAKPKPRKKKSQRGPQSQGQPGAKPAPKKDQVGTPKPAQTRPSTTTVTVSGGRGSARGTQPQQQQAAPSPAVGGNGGGGGRGGSPGQGNRPQGQRPALARGSEEFVRRYDDSHVSFADEKRKPDTTRTDGSVAVAKHNPPNRGRDFDRHSGTGRSPVENKKGGGGHSNWGRASGEDDLAAIEDVKADVAAESGEVKKDENKKRKKKKKSKKGEEEEETEKKDEIPDEQLKTFDDFLKEQAAKAVKLSLPPARAAGEGVKADPKWAEAVKREESDETFVKSKEEPATKEGDDDSKKPSKSALRKKKKKEAKESAAKKLAEENISSMFDFSAKKENEFGSRGRGRGGPRDRGQGGQRGPREDRGQGNQRGPREDRGSRGPREDRGGQGSQRGSRGGSARASPQPRKFKIAEDDAPQFDASAFPALQVGPPPITVD